MKSKNKIYFILTGLILLFSAFVFFAILPLFSMVKKSAQELESVKNKIIFLSADIDNFSLIVKQYQEYQPNLDKINTLFADMEVPIDFIRFLEKTAQDSNVSIKISSVSEKKGGVWSALSFQVSTESAFLDLSRLIEKLENSPYLISMQNLTINKSGGQGSAEKVSANFTIQVFAQ